MAPKRSAAVHRHRSPRENCYNVLFEDDDIIVAEKPAGLLTIATDREKRQTLYAFLYEYLKRKHAPEQIFIVHRLDREASGLLVFAKTKEAKYHLQEQFKEHSTDRIYVAVAENQMARDTYTFESYLAENAFHRSYSTPDRRKGSHAITHVTVLKRSAHRTLVEVKLETGRKHQIRVHLAEKGFPIVGDRAYGSSSSPIRRMALHAANLAFTHPRTGKRMEFHSPPPASFAKLVS